MIDATEQGACLYQGAAKSYARKVLGDILPVDCRQQQRGMHVLRTHKYAIIATTRHSDIQEQQLSSDRM